jgi:hypothetical protein
MCTSELFKKKKKRLNSFIKREQQLYVRDAVKIPRNNMLPE